MYSLILMHILFEAGAKLSHVAGCNNQNIKKALALKMCIF